MKTEFHGQSLLTASSSGDLEAVIELLQKKADIHYENELGQTPLMCSVLGNHFRVTELLLNGGSDPNHKDRNGLSPFIAAAAGGFSDLVYLMQKYGADKNSINRFGGTALLPSSEKGYVKTVQYCLDFGVPVNHVNKLGWTALHEAVILGDGQYLYTLITRLLLESGADAHLKDRHGISPLEYAHLTHQENLIDCFEKRKNADDKLEEDLLTNFKKGNYDKGLKIIKSSTGIRGSDDLLCFWKGLFLQEKKHYKEAIDAYHEGLKLQTGRSQFYFYIANCYRLMKYPEKSLEIMDYAISDSIDPSFFLYHKSNFLRELNRHEEAIAVMNRLLKLSPERPDYLFHKANSLRSIHRHAEAIIAMNQASALDEGNELFIQHREDSAKLLDRNHLQTASRIRIR